MSFVQRFNHWMERPLEVKLKSFQYNYRAAKLRVMEWFGSPDELMAELPWGRMRVHSDWLGKNIYFGSYERKEMAALSKILKPGSIAIDVGANIGYYSIFLEKALKCCKVLSFEPSPRELERLNENLLLNRCQSVTVVNLALGDRNGTTEFYISDSNFGRNSISEINNNAKKVTVSITTLDEYLHQHPEESIDFIKIDIEGAETIMLKGAANTIEKYRPVILFESWAFDRGTFGEFTCEASSIIRDHRYDFFDISESGLLIHLKNGMAISSQNLIAIPTEKICTFSNAIKNK